jgi:TolA-binding protein
MINRLFVKCILTGAFVIGAQVLTGTAFAQKANDKTAAPKVDDGMQSELLIAKTEEQAILQIKKLLKKYKNTSLEPDLLQRLADMHMRRAKTDRFLQFHRDNEETVSVTPQLIKNATPIKQVKLALDVYADIQRRYPRFERLDVVIFDEGYAAQEIGDNVRAEKSYRRLIANFPQSSLMPDAHLAVGEMEFRNKKFSVALTHFNAIRNYPNAMVYPYGIYKAAWSYYNLRDSLAALKQLEDVVAFGKKVNAEGIDARLDLRKEALADMTLFFEDTLPVTDAFKYFTKQSGDLDPSPYILKLTGLYKRHSRYADALVLLGDYTKKLPEIPALPLAYLEVMDTHEKMKRPDLVVKTMFEFQAVCSQGSKWEDALSDAPAKLNETKIQEWKNAPEEKISVHDLCVRGLRKNALSYAQKWNKLREKNKEDTKLADAVETTFALYLSYKDASDEAGRARFVYAEVLFQREKFREASVQYALATPLLTDATLNHDSSYNAIFALEKSVSDKWTERDELLFLDLARIYLKSHPQGKYALDVTFKKSFIAYEKGRYDEASEGFLKLGRSQPNSERGKKSYDLYMDILNIKKQYIQLRDFSLVLKNKETDKDRLQKLTKIFEESYFLVVQNYEKENKLDLAVAEYKRFAKEQPNSPLAPNSHWNAIQLQFKIGDLQGGSLAAVEYAEKFSKEKNAKDALLKAAATYESLGLLKDAATTVEKLAVMDKSEEEKWLVMATDFYLLDYDFQAALRIVVRLENLKTFKDKVSLLIKREYIASKTNDVKMRQMVMKELMDKNVQPFSSQGHLEIAEQQFNANKFQEAFQSAKKIIAAAKSGASKEALAKARLLQARVLSAEFKSQSVKSQPDRMHIVLELKTNKLAAAQSAYQDVLHYGHQPSSEVALSELADCYLIYADHIRWIPEFKGVTAEEWTAFKHEMENLATPMEEKGIETLMQTYKVTRESGNKQLMQSLVTRMQKLSQPLPEEEYAEMTSPQFVFHNKTAMRNGARGVRDRCPANEFSWRKEKTETLIEAAMGCVTAQNWVRLEQVAQVLAIRAPTEFWGPYYMSEAALNKKEFERASWMVNLSLKKQMAPQFLSYQKARVLWLSESRAEALVVMKSMDKTPDAEMVADGPILLGQFYTRIQDYKSAKIAFLRWTKIESENSSAFASLGDVEMKLRNHTAAVDAFVKAIELSPSNIPYRLRLAVIYENSLKEPAKALLVYSRIQELMNDNQRFPQSQLLNIREKIESLKRELEPQTKKGGT